MAFRTHVKGVFFTADIFAVYLCDIPESASTVEIMLMNFFLSYPVTVYIAKENSEDCASADSHESLHLKECQTRDMNINKKCYGDNRLEVT